jgi:alcohol dehydrogenase (cytochrome c)
MTRIEAKVRYLTRTLLLGAACLGAAIPAAARAGVTEKDILDDANTPADVVSYGMSPHQHRFSKLDKINDKNVQKLVPAWTLSFGGEKQRGQQAQPVVYDGRIITTASYSRVFAADVHTGEKLWEYDHRLPEGILPCCDVINRGGALFGDLFIFGTLDGQVVALKQATGKVAWKTVLGDYAAGVSITHTPIIAKGMALVAIAGSEFGVVGTVSALDALTGKVIWTRPTIEGWMGTKNGQDNGMTGTKNATWPGDMWKNGGGCAWNGGIYDPETNLSYWGVGNAAPWNPYYRPGDNLYGNSVIAIDVDSGQIVWHYQHVPNDAWDYDSMSVHIPFDLKKDGKVTKAIGNFHKNGFFYVNDRKTGKLINATPFVKNITWASKIDLETGRPVEPKDKDGNYLNRPGDPSKSEDGKKGTTVWTVPNFLGGNNWNPPSFDEDTGLFYAATNEWGMDIWNEPITYKKGAAYLGAAFVIKPVFPDHIGSLKAVDPKDGHIVWEAHNKGVYWGGVLTTHGNLVFTGTPEGYLKAWDARTGKELWKYNTGSGITGSPITWEQDGEQWIAVVSGWGGAVPLWGGEVAKSHANITQGGSLWAFKLPK